jgi:hypothetical protein
MAGRDGLEFQHVVTYSGFSVGLPENKLVTPYHASQYIEDAAMG